MELDELQRGVLVKRLYFYNDTLCVSPSFQSFHTGTIVHRRFDAAKRVVYLEKITFYNWGRYSHLIWQYRLWGGMILRHHFLVENYNKRVTTITIVIQKWSMCITPDVHQKQLWRDFLPMPLVGCSRTHFLWVPFRSVGCKTGVFSFLQPYLPIGPCSRDTGCSFSFCGRLLCQFAYNPLTCSHRACIDNNHHY